MTLEAPAHLAKYLAPKGSICIDGVSLTIAALNGNQFDVALIPTTLQSHHPRQARKSVGPSIIEADIISKQIVHFLENRDGRKSTEKSSICSMYLLAEMASGLISCHFTTVVYSLRAVMDYRPTIAITMGDPAGIGAGGDRQGAGRSGAAASGAVHHLRHERIAALRSRSGRVRCLLVARSIQRPAAVLSARCGRRRLRPIFSMLGIAIRSPSKMGGEASMRFCLDAIDAAQKKLVDAVVTAPIAKESWKLAGFHYPGHTELFAQQNRQPRDTR